MRLNDVKAAELTEPLESPPGASAAPAADATPQAAGARAEPLLLTQEVPAELFASEYAAEQHDAEPAVALRGLRALLHVQWMRWAEKRHAERTTRAVVARYRDILARYPGLPVRDALCLLVMEHARCDDHAARRVLANAENSFSTWPADRNLNLADVAHYLAVSEFLALHCRERGIRSDIGHLVGALVPRELLARSRS